MDRSRIRCIIDASVISDIFGRILTGHAVSLHSSMMRAVCSVVADGMAITIVSMANCSHSFAMSCVVPATGMLMTVLPCSAGLSSASTTGSIVAVVDARSSSKNRLQALPAPTISVRRCRSP